MYKPNFCNDCGERIARKRWRLWTNRQFCPKCTTRLRAASVLKKPLLTAAILSLGFFAGSNGKPDAPPLILERGNFAASNEQIATSQTASLSPNIANSLSNSSSPNQSQLAARSNSVSDITDPNEVVSMCGARTKKGTPCSRRVRGYGRCWQHKGKSAMLPAGKLVIQS